MTFSNRSLKGSLGINPSMSEISIHDRMERFLDRKFRTSRSFSTKATYRATLKKFVDFVYQDYNQDLDNFIDNLLNKIIDPIEALDNYYTYLIKAKNPYSNKKGYSNATIIQYVVTAKEFLNDADCRIYSEDVRRKFKLPRRVNSYSEGLTKDAIAQILRLANYKLSTVILLACSSGMRLGEIIQLKFSDIDFETNPTTIKIRAETTKTRESRVTHITKEATQALKDFIAKSKRDWNYGEYVFLLSYENKLEQLLRNKNSGKLKTAIEKKLEGISEEEKIEFRARITKQNFENQLRGVIRSIPELSKKAENGRFNVHFHAFRYFFKTQVTDAHESDFAEALLGHKSLKLVYYRQNTKKRQKTYLDVEHTLTISETENIEKNYTELQQDNRELRDELNLLIGKFRELEKRIEVKKSYS